MRESRTDGLIRCQSLQGSIYKGSARERGAFQRGVKGAAASDGHENIGMILILVYLDGSPLCTDIIAFYP